jgi:polyisoprenoid-binding protein YceI
MSTTPTSTEPKQPAAIRRWTLDPARSAVEFKVRHFWGLITVTGDFDRFDGTYTSNRTADRSS